MVPCLFFRSHKPALEQPLRGVHVAIWQLTYRISTNPINGYDWAYLSIARFSGPI